MTFEPKLLSDEDLSEVARFHEEYGFPSRGARLLSHAHAQAAIIADLSRQLDECHQRGAALVAERDALAAQIAAERENHNAWLEAHNEDWAEQIQSIRYERKQSMAVVAALEDEVNRASDAVSARDRGGQHVPYLGDFANATPSVLSALRRWARDLRETGSETSVSISDWANATFGEIDSNMSVFNRAWKEWNELSGKLHDSDDHPGTPEEIADVAIVLARIMTRFGTDLQVEIDKKMRINRARKWKLTGDGHGQHVEEEGK